VRIRISKQNQRIFFARIKYRSGLGWDALSDICGVSPRTLRDWSKAIYTPSLEISKKLGRFFGVVLPKNIKPLEKYWYIKKYARIGALARQKIYGMLGSKETRRLAGIISQQRRRENPEKYKLLGCNIRKSLKKPLKYSTKLAELFGIILGDGGITDNQVKITLNRKTDREYSIFVKKLVKKTLGEVPSLNLRDNVINVAISGAGIVEELEKFGLKRGNKVFNQVGIPSWIARNKEYAKACLRGLMDTDGGVYFHHHTVRGNKYVNFGLTLSNHSKPLLTGAYRILLANYFSPSISNNKKIYIYNLEEVKRYFKVIGSSNQKHIDRLKLYLKLYKN